MSNSSQTNAKPAAINALVASFHVRRIVKHRIHWWGRCNNTQTESHAHSASMYSSESLWYIESEINASNNTLSCSSCTTSTKRYHSAEVASQLHVRCPKVCTVTLSWYQAIFTTFPSLENPNRRASLTSIAAQRIQQCPSSIGVSSRVQAWHQAFMLNVKGTGKSLC